MMDVEVVVNEKVPKNSIILEGFQGVGLVGTLAAQYIAEKTNAKLVGYITSDALSPMALLIEGEIRHPMRIYQFKKGSQNFLIFESELPIPHKLSNIIAREIANFAKKNGIKEIVSLEGIATPKKPTQSNVYYVTNMTDKVSKKVKDNAKLLKNGIIIGTSAALLIQAKLQKIFTYALMAEAHSKFPDGLAASELVKKINEIYNLEIDTSVLEKESKEFENRLWKVVKKAEKLKSSEGQPKKTYIG